MNSSSILLEVNNLKVNFYTDDGVVEAVNDISFNIKKGETLGVVGESGSGKSVTSLSIMRLIDSPGKIVQGQILLENDDLLKKKNSEMRKIRGNKIAMIFQEPMTSLNPLYTIGNQVSEAVMIHQRLPRLKAFEKTLEVLRSVEIPNPEKRSGEYPFQLSGGLKQRVMIGMGLSCLPKLLIADEPTTALDVTIQAQVLKTLKRLKKELHMALLLITHDLGVIAEVAERVVVMYAGKIVEEARVDLLFEKPMHPYTESLLIAIPRIDEPKKRLYAIPGSVPDMLNKPKGCNFHPRCKYAFEKCREEEPPLVLTENERRVSCWLRMERAKGGVA